jgi:hypothetical protein
VCVVHAAYFNKWQMLIMYNFCLRFIEADDDVSLTTNVLVSILCQMVDMVLKPELSVDKYFNYMIQ